MAIQKKTEGRDLDEYLQEVWDSLEPAWDKSKFDMKQGYDSEYECDCITITSKDNEGVLAKIYVNDYEGRHPVGFDVVYRYPGDKGVGVMGSYEFQSTDMDGLGEEVFDYFDEIKQKVGESKKNEANTPEEAIKQILMDAAEDNEFRREAGADFSVEDYEKSIDANIERLRDYFLECFYFDEGEFKCEVQDHEETRNLCSLVASKVGYALGLSDGVETAIDGYLLWYGVQENIVSDESKKSESLTLKQKELKDMARFGQAEDITTISDEEAKALRKKGIETIGISRGTYGMNGALLRDNEGKTYVITARSSNLFYFV